MDAFNRKADDEVTENTATVDAETSKGGNREELNKKLRQTFDCSNICIGIFTWSVL